jgi:hypothetical protein
MAIAFVKDTQTNTIAMLDSERPGTQIGLTAGEWAGYDVQGYPVADISHADFEQLKTYTPPAGE